MQTLHSSQEKRGVPVRHPDLDKAGAAASLTCAIHCAAMPLVVTLLPLVGLSFLADERLEWGLLAVSASLGVSSLCFGFREHGSRRALVILAVGLSLLALGRISEERAWGGWAVPVVVAGGCTVAASHLLNRRLCHTCRRCRSEVQKTEGQRTQNDSAI